MKMISLKRLAALSAILILRINSAGAAPIPPPIPDTVVNMPATAANSVVNDPNDYCYVGPGAVIFAATDPASFCTIAFPIAVPVGHVIKQITVIHGNGQVFLDPHIEAKLDVRQTVAPFGYSEEFVWSADTYTNTFDRTRLMAQIGNTYYDAFPVESAAIYSLVVSLWHGATVAGLEITYN